MHSCQERLKLTADTVHTQKTVLVFKAMHDASYTSLNSFDENKVYLYKISFKHGCNGLHKYMMPLLNVSRNAAIPGRTMK